MNNEDKNKKLEELERRQRKLSKEQRDIADEIERLRTEPDEQIPWEPKQGVYEVGERTSPRTDSRLIINPSQPKKTCYMAGSQYPTQKAAESVAKRDYFFRRLCALACELNPSGVLGQNYGVIFSEVTETPKWKVADAGYARFVDCVFATREAAEKAASIMNRDQWRLD